MAVQRLGYIGIQVSDAEAWNSFLVDGLGVMNSGTSPSGQRLYRTDSYAWRIAVESGPRDDVTFVGYEVPDEASLDQVRKQIEAAGFSVTPADRALLEERQVLGLISCKDPDGLDVEVYFGALERDDAPFASPKGIAAFVTGDQGFGHLLQKSRDMNATRAFYCKGLGFKLSDIISLPLPDDQRMNLEFYHCNPRHHTVAFLPVDQPKTLHHFMLQVRSIDEVGYAMERVERLGAQITLSLGRHSNDRMVSFYAKTPSGFDVEFGYDAITVDDRCWRVTTHNKTSVWGHKTPDPQPVEWKPPAD